MKIRAGAHTIILGLQYHVTEISMDKYISNCCNIKFYKFFDAKCLIGKSSTVSLNEPGLWQNIFPSIPQCEVWTARQRV